MRTFLESNFTTRRTFESVTFHIIIQEQNTMAAKRVAIFHPEFLEDLEYWVATDRKLALRLLKMINEILRDPFKGTGKPEPLKYESVWSRRLNDKDRIVYLVSNVSIDFLHCRGHYDD